MPRAAMSVAIRILTRPLLELGQRPLALRLALVAVDRVGGDAVAGEQLHHPVGAMLGAGEDQHPVHVAALGKAGAQHHRQQRLLLALLDEADILLDPLDGGRRRRDRDLRRIGQELVGQLPDRLRHGRREEQGLALGRQQLTICLSAWMKPRSIIWSASSRTRISTSRRVRRAARPGRSAGRAWRRARRRRAPRPAGSCRSRCRRTRWRRAAARIAIGAGALGDLAGELAGRREHQHPARCGRGAAVRRRSRSIEGSMKAAVLPVPVWAMPSRSRPSERSGSPASGWGSRPYILRGKRLENGLRQPEGLE